MHNAAFRALGLDALYMPFEVKEGSLEGTVLALKAAGLRGANVTIPYKERIMAHLDGLDEDARRIGAVNTILNRDGALIGCNTDVRGLIDALKEAGVRLNNARAVLIGAGGAARAAAYGLLKENARVTVANRTRKRAIALRRHFGDHVIDVVDLKALGKVMVDADILVNCTPTGMRGFTSKSPVHGEHIRRGMAVLDMVYNPVRTPLLRLAERKGARAISGLEMFIRQGMESLGLWTGRTLPVETLRRALADSQDRGNRD
jgi:shikimate dehydrogenase